VTKPKPTIPVVARITSPAGAHTYRAAGLGEEPIYEILNRMPVTAEQHQWHENERARLMRDKTWVQRYMSGVPDAHSRLARFGTFSAGKLHIRIGRERNE
jgi:hypothetical protein